MLFASAEAHGWAIAAVFEIAFVAVVLFIAWRVSR